MSDSQMTASLTADDTIAVVGQLRELRAQRGAGQLDELGYRQELERLLERRRFQEPIAFPDRRR